MTLAPGALRLLAGAALLSLALAQEYCNTASIGDTIGETVTLEGQPIDRDVLTFEISEPDVCPESNPVGMLVSACDVDQGPQVHLLDTTRGLVVREGSLEHTAYVFITFYCPALNSDESSIETSESPTLMSRLSPSLLQSQPSPKSQQYSQPSSLSLLQTWVDTASGSSIPTESSQVNQSESPLVESLPSIQLESRFSALPQSVPSPTKLKFPPSPPVSLSSRWKENEALMSEQTKSLSQFEGEQSKIRDSYNLLLSNLKSKYSKESRPSLPSLSWLKPAKPSLAKRLSSSLPDSPALLANRTPSWLKRPAKGPSSPWLRVRSNLAWPNRRFLPNSRLRTPTGSFDNDDPWAQYEDDTMSLHWSDDHVEDQYPRWSENVPSNPANNGLYRPNNLPVHRLKHDGLPESHLPLQQERPSSLPIRHPPNYPSPVHKEDPPLFSEWKDKPSPLVPSSKRPLLPKLLLLLQDPDHTLVSRQKCTSAHSVEDTEPWWPNYPQSDDGIPWQPEYPADYSADDGDTWPMGRHTNEGDQWARHIQIQNDQEEHYNHPQYYHNNGAKTPSHKQTLAGPSPDQLASPPWCPKCTPDNYLDYGSQLKAQISPTPFKKETLSWPQAPVQQTLDLKEPHGAYVQPVLTERPMLSSTVRNSVSWVKSKPAVGKSAGAPEADMQSPAAPWNFLSRLLLSHPTFRDSTHVIRI